MIIETPRTRLRPWREADRDAFAALHADAEVMRDLGGPIGRAQSDAKLDRYAAAFDAHGLCRWAIENLAGDFLGYAGVMPSRSEHPIGPHFEIGWRLERRAWGHGYATEAARAALNDAFTRAGLAEVVAYTAPDNLRSQAVMARLGLRREPSRDFTAVHEGTGTWRGWVWVGRPAIDGEITVRPASGADAATIAETIVAAFEQYRGRLAPESGALKETAAGLMSELQAGAGGLVAERDGAMVGCVITRPVDGDLYFGRLSVHPAVRGQGVGRRLVDAVEAEGRRLGALGTRLSVRIALPENQAFFSALGYAEIGRESHPGFEQPTFIKMRKSLGA